MRTLYPLPFTLAPLPSPKSVIISQSVLRRGAETGFSGWAVSASGLRLPGNHALNGPPGTNRVMVNTMTVMQKNVGMISRKRLEECRNDQQKTSER